MKRPPISHSATYGYVRRWPWLWTGIS